MKTKYIICALGLVMLSTSSCNDFLNEDPKGQLIAETFFASQDELNMATYALYRKVCDIQVNTNPTIPSWQGDDLTTNSGSNKQAYAEVDGFHPTDANKGVDASWSTGYTAIKAANYIILNAEKTPTTQEELNIAIGQAKYWRAANYFWLVRRWGQVPLVLDNEINYERPLASIEEVYNQIVKDLQDCVATLPTTYSTAPRYISGANIYITKQAAQATLAAVYMAMAGWPLKQTQYYASAAEQAKAVIDGVNKGDYEYILEPDYKNVYAISHNYTNETVVGINYSGSFQWDEDSQMTNSNMFESLGGWGDGWGEIKFWKEFPAGPRKDATYNPKILKGNKAGAELIDWWDKDIPEQHPMFSIFSIGQDGGDYDYTKPANVSVSTNGHRHRLIRYSEVLLWYAEAQARADGTPNAMAYECINKVRERAGLEPLQSGLSGDAFANAAFQEHGWEVCGYWVALVTRRDDQMRMELLEKTFNERKINAPIEVAPGVMLKEGVNVPESVTWQGEKSIYLPYPSSDTQLNSNLKR
ncbi:MULTISPECIES: RagB/SusD family nutrient uptake outer membrane protein [Parabacteroides]|uniref:RagB/SusD family nutrient uptake outer membrane protein n=1 Tax=Parabacteroides leei TaxID=2939491 RepID=UPI00189A15E9|nr:RagB/SusD family nutrient uptake outer membrane protein [Parabacteroides goldsteinii]